MPRSSSWTLALLTAAAAAVVQCKQRGADVATVKEDRVNSFDTANPFPDYTIIDHGGDCFRELGTALPEFSCLDGALLDVKVDGQVVTDRIPARCDNPDLVDPATACVPGARLLRVDEGDTTAMIMCRRFRADVVKGETPRELPVVWPVDDPHTDNIAIIHYNRKSKAACFYQIRKLGMDGTRVPPPFSPAESFAERVPKVVETYVAPGLLVGKDACVRCHDNQIWLRTPLVQQLVGHPDKKLARHALPRDVRTGPLKYPGRAFAPWMTPEKRTVYMAINPDTMPGGTAEVPSNYCTSCHDLGKSRMVEPDQAEGTCQLLARPWFDAEYRGPVEGVFLTERDAAHRFWMPPDVAVADEDEYRKTYAGALAAVKRCCEDPLQAECQHWPRRANPNQP